MGIGVVMVTYGSLILRHGLFSDQPLATTFSAVGVLDMAMSTASFLGLVFVSLERMGATVYPLRHRRLGNRAYYLGIAFQWFYPVLGVPPLFFLQNSIHNLIAAVAAPLGLAVIGVSYLTIYISVKKQHVQHHQGIGATQANAQLKERELAKTLFIVTGLSFVTWVPDAVEVGLMKFYLNFHMISNLLRCINSVINPVVYIFRMKDFRRVLKSIVCRCSRDQLQPIGLGPHLVIVREM
ncbi:predicted protein [Nematostella vectensis]|uniref:G-protein coupled receptors family 1 profile domain-containing protein n=1 Tax=Nematostella vectensis TaxID=45351 RepID=A7S6G5_NEMVE|nr:predicted protein [Nematostella vectensis]|eukprot:XP_001632779.1 predicted protein [Nematostella vectensis]